MTKPMNPLLKQENRQELIRQAMQSISDKQAKVIKQADKIIDNVAIFEDAVHKQFISYTG